MTDSQPRESLHSIILLVDNDTRSVVGWAINGCGENEKWSAASFKQAAQVEI
jgi:hypothetical protein